MNTAATPPPSLNEPSGSHRLPGDDGNSEASFRVPKGTLVVLLTAVLAAGGGTGITSIVTGGGHRDEVAVAVEGVKGEMAALRVEVAQVNKAIGDVQARLTSDAVVREQVASELADHEKRLRDLERRLR